MKTVTVKSVFEAILRMRALDPATVSLSAAQTAKHAELINDAVLLGWEHEWWPEIMEVEERQYRPTWDATDNYAEDDEVYYEDGDGDGAYYVSLQDGNVAQTPDYDDDTDYWAKAGDDFVRTIDFDQEGENEIGGVDTANCVFDVDPRVYPRRAALEDVILVGRSILVKTDTAPLKPWIKYRPPAPEFSLTEWSAATAYAIGDLCYLDTYGETYKALQSSTNKDPYTETEYWEPVEFPWFLRHYVKHAVAGMLLREDEGRYKAQGEAQAWLERMAERIVDAQVPVMRRARFRRG